MARWRTEMAHESFTMTVGGVDFVADVEINDSRDWTVERITLDLPCEWPFKHDMYDLLGEFALEKIESDVAEKMFDRMG